MHRILYLIVVAALLLAGCASPTMSMKSFKGQCLSNQSTNFGQDQETMEPCDLYGTKLICQNFTSSVARVADRDECLAACGESEAAMRKAHPLGGCLMTIRRAEHLCRLYCTRNYD